MPKTSTVAAWPTIAAPAPAPIVLRKRAARAYIGNVSDTLLDQLARSGEIEKIYLGQRAIAYPVASLDAFLARRIAESREAAALARIAAPEAEAGIVASTR